MRTPRHRKAATLGDFSKGPGRAPVGTEENKVRVYRQVRG
jgi:hypothetical protein